MVACSYEGRHMFLRLNAIADIAGPALFESASGRLWTRVELFNAVRQFGERLYAAPKKLIFHFCANNAGSVIAYLAGCKAGHAVALLDTSMRPEFIAELFRRYRPDIVFSGGAFSVETIVNEIGDTYLAEAEEFEGIRLWRRLGIAHEPIHPDLAVLLSTSGTTGSPKFVRLTRQNLECNARSIQLALSLNTAERAITSLPMFYSYGLSVINSHIVAGAAVVLTAESILSKEFWNIFRQFHCTSFAGVPYAYEMLARIGLEQFEVPTLMTLTQAGGKLHRDLILRFHQFMAKREGRFFVMYGQTEATARIACLPPAYLPEKVGAVGFAIPDGSLAVEVNGEQTHIPYQSGEVIYHGPNVMMGYATHRGDLAKGDELRGYLFTGDEGYLDEQGLLYITGRTKRIAKVYGSRVNLDEIEHLMRPYSRAAVLGGEDRLIIFCEQGDNMLFQQWRQDLSQRLKLHHKIFEFRRIEVIPLLGNGKVDYTTLSNTL
jgi:acyl-CoA synthetase (AMP-forming)/AMP-acid ligase II